jgi:hypothetical protein
MITVERKKAAFEPIKMTINTPEDLRILRAVLSYGGVHLLGAEERASSQMILSALPKE